MGFSHSQSKNNGYSSLKERLFDSFNSIAFNNFLTTQDARNIQEQAKLCCNKRYSLQCYL